MKQLKENDIDSVIEKLNALDRKYGLKNRMLVENTLASPQMKKFTENGWRNDYYLFIKLYQDDVNRGFSADLNELIAKTNPSEQEQNQLKELAKSIAAVIKEQKSTDLSFYGYVYPFVKRYLEPLLPADINYNTFAVEAMPYITETDMPERSGIDVSKDKRVKNILIDPGTYFHITL